MDLKKKNIYRNSLKGRAVSQITLDDDYNVADSKPDIAKIIQDQSDIVINDVKAEQSRALIRGALQFRILYMSEDDDRSLHNMSGEIPFEETVNIEGVSDGDNIKIKWMTDDMTTGLINSRKISVKAVVTFLLSLEEMKEEETAIDLEDAEGVEYRKKGLNLVELAVNKKDIYRVKEELTLPSNKPNIYELIWQSVQLRNVDLKCVENRIAIKGELLIFFIYRGEDELKNIQWLEVSQPFSGSIDCFGCREEYISDMDVRLSNVELEAKPDYDGEQRMVSVDAVLDLDIKLYEEEYLELLEDVYSSRKELIPITRPAYYEALLVKNFSKCRMNEKITIPNKASRILQICHSEGEIKLDEVMQVEEGLQVEGVVDLKIIYLSSDDNIPIHAMKGSAPFHYLIEASGLCREATYNLRAEIEQLSTTVSDSEEIEVKAVIDLNLIVMCKVKEDVIVDIREAPLDYNKLEELPGIVGYIVKEGDSLWKLAKKYYTTVDKIKEMNGLTSDAIKPGDRFLIIKSIEAMNNM